MEDPPMIHKDQPEDAPGDGNLAENAPERNERQAGNAPEVAPVIENPPMPENATADEPMDTNDRRAVPPEEIFCTSTPRKSKCRRELDKQFEAAMNKSWASPFAQRKRSTPEGDAPPYEELEDSFSLRRIFNDPLVGGDYASQTN